MENQQSQNQNQPTLQKTDRQLLEEIHEHSRKTKNYMMWQLIITVAFVILPLLAALLIIPFALNSLTSIYNISSGVGSTESLNGLLQNESVKGLLDQYLQK